MFHMVNNTFSAFWYNRSQPQVLIDSMNAMGGRPIVVRIVYCSNEYNRTQWALNVS
jgi:hypothetical protein